VLIITKEKLFKKVNLKAKEALDELYIPNPYLKKDKHYLTPLEPKILNENSIGIISF
jgi:hypothetical protein